MTISENHQIWTLLSPTPTIHEKKTKSASFEYIFKASICYNFLFIGVVLIGMTSWKGNYGYLACTDYKQVPSTDNLLTQVLFLRGLDLKPDGLFLTPIRNDTQYQTAYKKYIESLSKCEYKPSLFCNSTTFPLSLSRVNDFTNIFNNVTANCTCLFTDAAMASSALCLNNRGLTMTLALIVAGIVMFAELAGILWAFSDHGFLALGFWIPIVNIIVISKVDLEKSHIFFSPRAHQFGAIVKGISYTLVAFIAILSIYRYIDQGFYVADLGAALTQISLFIQPPDFDFDRFRFLANP